MLEYSIYTESNCGLRSQQRSLESVVPDMFWVIASGPAANVLASVPGRFGENHGLVSIACVIVRMGSFMLQNLGNSRSSLAVRGFNMPSIALVKKICI